MISISQWGLIEAANMEVDSHETAGWMYERGIDPGSVSASNCRRPAWWAASPYYQALNFGSHLS